MKKIILLLTVLFIGITAVGENSLSGKWHYIGNNQYGEDINFLLDLTQINYELNGWHSIVACDGRYIDYEGDESIKGCVKDGVAYISIKSGRTANIAGNAEIRYVGTDSIEFVLTKEPSGGDHFIPDKVILEKRKE